MNFTTHRYCALFPALPESEFKELVESIRKDGQDQPIVMFEGEILDGWHRYMACTSAGVKPGFREYEGNDPEGFVLRANIHRRHLTVGQRAMLLVELKAMKNACRNSGMAHSEHAESLGISRDSVTVANKIKDESPKLAKQVLEGKISLNEAEKKLPKTAAISSSAAKVAKAVKAEPAIVRDQTGYRIPESVLPLWVRRIEPKSMLQKLSDVRSFVRNLMNERANGRNDILYQECATHGTLSELDMAYADLKRAIPFAVCPFCQGVNAENCRTCKGRGMISRHMWDQAVPADMKSVRAKSCTPVAHVKEEP